MSAGCEGYQLKKLPPTAACSLAAGPRSSAEGHTHFPWCRSSKWPERSCKLCPHTVSLQYTQTGFTPHFILQKWFPFLLFDHFYSSKCFPTLTFKLQRTYCECMSIASLWFTERHFLQSKQSSKTIKQSPSLPRSLPPDLGGSCLAWNTPRLSGHIGEKMMSL